MSKETCFRHLKPGEKIQIVGYASIYTFDSASGDKYYVKNSDDWSIGPLPNMKAVRIDDKKDMLPTP